MLSGVRWQQGMAEALGVNMRTVRRWSSGEQTPPGGVIESLLKRIAAQRTELDELEAAISAYLEQRCQEP